MKTEINYQFYVLFPFVDKCQQFKNKIVKNTTPLMCEYCHKACTNLPKILTYQVTNKTIRWYCEECKRDRSDHVRKVGSTKIEIKHLYQGNTLRVFVSFNGKPTV